MQHPEDFSRWRFKQNIVAEIDSHGYQRQTGRSTRIIIDAILAVLDGNNVLLLYHDFLYAGKHHIAYMHEWINQLLGETHYISQSVKEDNITTEILIQSRVKDDSYTSITIGEISTMSSALCRAKCDYIFFDNSVTDYEYTKPTAYFTKCVEELTSNRDIKNLPDKNLWSTGDLLQLPSSDSVGAVMSLTFAYTIPIGITILFENRLLTFPFEACELFHKIK